MEKELIYKTVQQDLGYAWIDDDTEAILERQTDGGISFLQRYDPSISFDDAFSMELLITYVRYLRSNALDDFAENYRSELLFLQHQGRIKKNAGQ